MKEKEIGVQLLEDKRVKELKSNFLNKYVYSGNCDFNTTLSCNFLFCFTFKFRLKYSILLSSNKPV